MRRASPNLHNARKALIAKAKDQAEKIELADKLAIKRLATGVLPELDACFDALALK